MSKKTNRHSYGTYHYYRCTTHTRMDTDRCTGQTIRVDRLEKAVLVFLQTMVDAAVAYEDLLGKIRRGGRRKPESSALSRTLEQQLSAREKCHRMSLDLYPDWKSGILTQEEFRTLKADLNARLQALDSTIEKLQESIGAYDSGTEQENAFLTSFKKHRNFTELSRSMLVELVREIRIYEGGRLEIVLNFQDELKALADDL